VWKNSFFGNIRDDTVGDNYASIKISLCHRTIDATDKSRRKRPRITKWTVYEPQVTQEGEELPYYQHELTVGGDGEEDKIFFIWPTTIVHKIDPASPLYHLSAAEMIRERFEIVVILEGNT